MLRDLAGNFELFQLILAQYPKSERLQALKTKNQRGETVLHFAADSHNNEIKHILALYPEPDRLQMINMKEDFTSFLK